MCADISNVLAKFVESKKQLVDNVAPNTGAWIETSVSLQEKLRQKANNVRQAQGIPQETDDIYASERLFKNCLLVCHATPLKCNAVIITNTGIQHDLKLSFESGKCTIISMLFPSPSYIVQEAPTIKPKDLTFTVKEFFDIAKIIKVFDGKNVSIIDEVNKFRNKTSASAEYLYPKGKRVILTTVENQKRRRGILDETIFYKDDTPIFWKSNISFEFDVIKELEVLGCKTICVILRDSQNPKLKWHKMKLHISLEEFKLKSYSGFVNEQHQIILNLRKLQSQSEDML